MAYTKNKFKISKEDLAKAYKRLGTIQKVADEYGVSKKLILNHMKEKGVKRNPSSKKQGEDYVNKLRRLSADGLNGVQIAKKLKTSSSTVYTIAARENIKITNNFHVGFIVTGSGYKLLRAINHPFSDSKGYVREHRLVMEGFLGRYLEIGECVHHIDGNKMNNSIENLELMTIEQHVRFHHVGKQGRGPDKKPRKKTLKI